MACCKCTITQPSLQEYAVPAVFICIFIGFTQIHQHEQQLPLITQASIDLPVWFSKSGSSAYKDRTWCTATEIRACTASATANACCAFLTEKKQPQSRISDQDLFLIATLVPFGLLLASCAISLFFGNRGGSTSYYGVKNGLAELNTAVYGLFLAFSLSLCVMECFKKLIGSPRPNFYSLTALAEYDSAYSRLLAERWKNVPSGHSTMACVFMLYSSFFLSAKLQMLVPFSSNKPNSNALRQLVLVLCYLPLMLGLWLASTRIQDFWHSNSAVILGLLNGAMCSAFVWVTSTANHCPYLWNASKATNEHSPVALKGGDLENSLS